jgi:plastocyanin
MRRTLPLLALPALVALLVFLFAGTAGAQPVKIFGTVGPGFTIGLADAQGNALTQLAPGQYELVVDDKSEFHNFHLSGPGVDVSTEVDFVGQTTFQITVTDGDYNYVCDPHAGTMRGKLTVGSGGSDGYTGGYGDGSGGSGGGSTAVVPSAPVGASLNVTAGPGFLITLKTKAGKKVTLLKAGAYTFVVRDRSASHNVHLRGAGVNKKTGVAATGTQSWKLTLKRGTLTFLCDPHATSMRGTVKIV